MNIRSICIIIITDKRITFLSTELPPLSGTQGRGGSSVFLSYIQNRSDLLLRRIRQTWLAGSIPEHLTKQDAKVSVAQFRALNFAYRYFKSSFNLLPTHRTTSKLCFKKTNVRLFCHSLILSPVPEWIQHRNNIIIQTQDLLYSFALSKLSHIWPQVSLKHHLSPECQYLLLLLLTQQVFSSHQPV